MSGTFLTDQEGQSRLLTTQPFVSPSEMTLVRTRAQGNAVAQLQALPRSRGAGSVGRVGKAGPHAVSWASRGFSFLIYATKWLSPRSCLWHPASAQSTGLHPCVFPAVTALFFDQWEHTTCLGLDEKLSPQASTGQHLTRASWGHKKKNCQKFIFRTSK